MNSNAIDFSLPFKNVPKLFLITTRRVFSCLGVKPGHGHGGKEFAKLLATRPAAAPKHQGRLFLPLSNSLLPWKCIFTLGGQAWPWSWWQGVCKSPFYPTRRFPQAPRAFSCLILTMSNSLFLFTL